MVITATVYCQNVYVVTKTTDPDPFAHKFDNIDSLCDPEMYGTLQWAINKVNSNSGDSRIEFNIPGAGPHEIILNYYLPQIKNATIIDGSTQSGYSYGNPQIIINAQHKHKSIFDVYSNNITIKGLKLTSFAQNGILLHECSNSLIAENIISNYSINSSNTPYTGLFINGCQNVEVYGNNIEVALDETVDEKTKSYGVYLSKSFNCIIGGTDTNLANTIKNCRNYGVFPRCSQNIKISGNIIYGSEKAIYLDSSNDNIQPPEISEYINGILSGTALPNSTIEVFGSTGAENANEYLASVIADENGDWEVECYSSLGFITSLQYNFKNNSSELSLVIPIPIIDCDSINLKISGPFEAYPGDYLKYECSGRPSSISSWTTSNQEVAQINENGEVQCYSSGFTNIIYTDIHGCTTSNLLTIHENSDYEKHSVYVLVKDSTILIDNMTDFLHDFDIVKVNMPFKQMNTDYMNRLYEITFNQSINIEKDSVISRLKRIEFIEYVEQIPIMYNYTDFCQNPNDPEFDELYYFELINSAQACEFYYPNYETRPRTVVGIVELYGVFIYHNDLINNANELHCNANSIIDGVCYDNNPNPAIEDLETNAANIFSHGAHVAGIAGAETNNNLGVASIGWNNYIMGVKCSTNGTTLFSGIDWAVRNGAKVINMSWGSSVPCLTHYMVFKGFRDEEEYKDVVFVASAGNSNTSSPKYPAAYGSGYFEEEEEYDPSLIIAVASINSENDKATSSSFGNWVDISAYGHQILSTIALKNENGNDYQYDKYMRFSGTSMAAPMISGIIGHMISYKPSASYSEIYNCLIHTANTDIYNSSHAYNVEGTLGSGRVDAEAALKCLGGDCSNGQPIAVIMPDNKVLCPESSVTLSANEGVLYAWSTGETTQSITVNETGAYSVTITFSDGCTASTTYKLGAANLIPKLYTIENSELEQNDGVACTRDSITLFASSGLNYQWNLSSSNQQSIVIASPLIYSKTAYVSIQDMDGCIGYDGVASANLSWTGFMAEAGDDIATCYGDIVFVAAEPYGSNYSYKWQLIESHAILAPILQTWNTPSVLFNYSYTHPNACMRLYMTDENTGCTSYDKLIINLIQPTQDQINFNNIFDYIFCLDSGQQHLYAEPSGGTWYGTGIINGEIFDPTIAGVGEHVLTYVAGSNNCNIQGQLTVTVLDHEIDSYDIIVLHDGEDPCSTTVRAYISESCYGFNGNVSLYNQNNLSDALTSFNGIWYTEFPKVYENLSPGNYIVIATTEIGGSEYVVSEEFTIHVPQISSLTVENNGPYCVGDMIEFHTTVNAGNYYYKWEGPNNYQSYNQSNTLNNCNTLMHGDYFLTVTDQNGCLYYGSTFIDIENNLNFSISNISYPEETATGHVDITLSYSGEQGSKPYKLYIVVFNSDDEIVRTDVTLGGELPYIVGIYNELPADTYTVVVHSADPSDPNPYRDCEYSYTFTIAEHKPVIDNYSYFTSNCNNGPQINILMNIHSGVPPYNVAIWHLGTNQASHLGNYNFDNSGEYLITIPGTVYPSGYFQAIISDANGVHNEAVIINQTVANLTNININQSDTFQDQSFIIGATFNPSLIINQDKTFTNCNLFCFTHEFHNLENTEGVAITVKQGSKLTLDNTKITSVCPDRLWYGIVVEGDWGIIVGTKSTDPGPGHLIVKNNSIIELANVAIFSDLNGVINITDSKFINCPIGLDLVNYDEVSLEWSIFPNLKPRAIINRNIFETNNNFITPPTNHIRLFSVDKITLKGNKFINSTNPEILTGNNRGIGIRATNSSFNVIENRHLFGNPHAPFTQQDKSIFDGLYYGIQAENTTAQSIKIRNCEFLNYDRIGAYLKNFNALTITSNTFDSYEFMEKAGLYLQDCNAYHVENNKFYDWTIGLIVNNSGTNANEIYRNSFFNNYFSLDAYYTNANQNGSTGLFIHCNKFNNSKFNFGANIYVAKGKIKKEQGYLHPTNSQDNVSAANLFSKTMLSEDKAFKASSSPLSYFYYCNQPGDNTDISGFTSPNISVHPLLTEYNNNTCKSKLPGIHLINPDMVIAIKADQILSLKQNFNNLVDGGNTPAVLHKVQNLRPNNFNKTCAELLNMSPYLSDTVLVTFMQTSVNGHTVAKTNVLLANSPLPENALAELENMNLPTPHKNTIYSHQTGTNPVIIKQKEIDELIFQKDLLVNDYVRYGLQSDSSVYAKDSLISYLSAENNYQAKCILIPILIDDKQYNDAQTQINELVYLASSENLLLQNELNDFANLQELIIITDTCKTKEDYRSVVESRLDLVNRLAYDKNHRCCAQAQTMLTIAGLDEFDPEFIYPMEERFLKVDSPKKIDHEDFDINDLVEIYPNPASKEIWIEYLILKEKPVTKIEVFNIEGKLILTQPIRSGFGIEQIDVSNLSEGNYIIKLGEFSKKISVMK